MSLTTYNQKRHFAKTPEPRGKAEKRKAAGLQFVVQKHDASRLHYDFRLEFEGVLKSWAVPKGPSFDPAKKSLAVQVEDHPVAYGDFEGIIPQGEYGGGTVMLWDRGTWEPIGDAADGFRRGKIRFRLQGEKLQGEWVLLQMHGRQGDGGKNWLLMKASDDYADRTKDITETAAFSVKTGRTLDEIAENKDAVWRSNRSSNNGSAKTPKATPKSERSTTKSAGKAVSAQLATLVDAPPTGKEWLHEVKFDGYRILAHCGGGKVNLQTRNGNDWTVKFKQIADALRPLAKADVVLDGEVVVLDKDGHSDFQSLQRFVKEGEKAQLIYYVFDLPVEGGKAIADLPLVERKKRLAAMLKKAKLPNSIAFSDHHAGDGESVSAKACEMGLEGIISKRADSAYVGRRSETWVKTKCDQRQEFVIVGFTPPQRSRVGLGALLLGYHDDNGDLCYAGRVGTGFDNDLLRDLTKRLSAMPTKTSPLADNPPARERREARWVKPVLVCEVRFTGWTRDGHLRHPVFIAMREDKPAAAVVREKAISSAKLGSKKAKPSQSTTPASSSDAEVAGVRLSHPDKVLYPEQGVTKIDIARYYELATEFMLPHVINRPLALVRCPAGRGSKCFFQRNYTDALPDTLQPINIGEKGEHDVHMQADKLAGVISLVQMGVLEIHTWNCASADIEHPDQLVFDLDPDESVPWKTIIQAAKDLRARLQEIGLPGFLKTSGGKGLHITVPIQPTIDWDAAKRFSQAVVDSLVRDQPELFLANMRKDLRAGKIYIDFQRNGRGATAVAPYSTRAREGAPVSMPISWEELGKLTSAAQFTVEQAPQYLKRRRRDPWREFEKARIDVRSVLAQGK
jgi:bifunctional non-homologous end joining protein LigD